MRRWVCVLWLGLVLGGCDGLTGDDDADGGTSSAPATPKWAEDNPKSGNDNAPRLRVRTDPFSSVSFFKDSLASLCSGTPFEVVAADAAGWAVLELDVKDDSTTFVYARARREGRDSGCSSYAAYVEDSTPPTRPTWSSGMPQVGTANTLRLSGSAPGAFEFTVHASSDCSGPELGRPAGNSWGDFKLDVTVEDDTTNSFTIRSVDEVGNAACSSSYVYVEDSLAPEAPVLTGTDPASPSRTTSLFVLGRTEPGATVTAYTSQECSGSSTGTPAKANAEGSFRVGVNPSNYNATSFYYVQARDAAGHLSPCVGPQRYVHDSVAPTLSDLTGFIPGSPANHNTPLLAGASQGAAVQARVYEHDGCLGEPLSTVAVDAAGKFQLQLRVPDDTVSRFYVELVDAAGNWSSCRASPSYVEDSTAPAAPTKVVLRPGALGATKAPSLTGEGPSGETALLFSTPDCQGAPVDTEALFSTSGTDTFQLDATVTDGSTTSFSVAVRDAAGNVSACVGPLTYVQDSVAPSTSGVVVVDGPAEDLAAQRTGSTVEAHWSDFPDAHGPVTYTHFLSSHPDCALWWRAVPERRTEGPAVKLEGLSLAEGTYYHCVFATDAVGNSSGFVRSNGFRVDLTPPVVSSSNPKEGDTDVDLLTPFVVTFREPMDPASVTRDTLFVEASGARVEGTVSCAQDTCSFQPSRPLPYRESVRLTVSTGARDVAGWPLASAYTASFTTRGRQWSASPAQVQAARPGLVPDVAVDGQGGALAVWVQGGADGTFRPYAARRMPHGTWSTPEVLDAVPAGEVDRPVVAVNAAGVGVAVWEVRSGSDTRLVASECAPASGWSAPRSIEQGTAPVGSARMAVDAQGHALVLFQQRDGATTSVWAVRRVAGVGWGSPLLLEAKAAPVAPALASDAAGNALAAWVAVDADGTKRVRVSRFSPQGAWAASEWVASFVDEAAPSVALSADGSASVVFRRSSSDGFINVLANRFVPGTGWGAEFLLGRGSPTWGETSVAMDRWGRVLVAWTGFGGVGPVLRLARYTAETGWQDVDVATGRATQPVVGADGQGNFHILWVENVSGEDRVRAARYPDGATALGPLLSLEPAHGGTSKRPRLAVSVGAGAAAVWYRDNGEGFSSNLVYSSAFE